jgi:hypothetical protein
MNDQSAQASSVAQEDAARRSLRKFLERSEAALSGPIPALRDPNNGMMGMQLHWASEDGEKYLVSGVSRPTLDPRVLDGALVECRVFFLVEEDCYIFTVIRSLQRLITREQAAARRGLKKEALKVVNGNRLVGSSMWSGRLGMDNGLGTGVLLGSDQITMDYINGVAFHQDEIARRRLENVSDMDSVRFSVLLQLDNLLRVIELVRAQILHDLEQNYLTIKEDQV